VARWTVRLGITAAVVAAVGGTAAWHQAGQPAGAEPASTPVAVSTITVPQPPTSVPAHPDAADAVPVDRCRSTVSRAVIVDLSEQHLWLCRAGVTVDSSAVTTGRDRSPTPTGRWTVYAKQTDRWLAGTGYSRQVERWMPFHGGIGFHDSAWQRMPYGSESYHRRGSHGCVHVPGPMMKRLYRWADVGTPVRVVP